MAEFVEVKQACMTFEGEDPEDPLQIEADEGAFGLEGAGQKEPELPWFSMSTWG